MQRAKVKPFFRNAKIERVQENSNEDPRRCAVLSSGREGLFAVSEAAGTVPVLLWPLPENISRDVYRASPALP